MKIDRRLARRLYQRVVKPNIGIQRVELLPEFDRWLGEMAEIDLTIYPGQRAVVRKSDHEVVLRWTRSPEDGLPYIVAISMEAPPGHHLNPEFWHELPLGDYWAALALRLTAREDVPDENAPRPAPGRGPSLGFYRKVKAEYDELVREGSSSPVSVLAERYGVRPGTVKAWRHRGSKYLKGTT